jgi:serine protease Do
MVRLSDKLSVMFRIILFTLITLFLFAPDFSMAQERSVPQAREEVQISFAPLVKQVSPAVVNIYTKRIVTRSYSPFADDPFFGQFFGRNPAFGGLSRRRAEKSLGSGVIVDDSGLLVTNAHVVNGATEIIVTLPDGREFGADTVLLDEPSDIALLRIVNDGEALPFANLKPSESLEVGDLVLAIGNPFGVGQTVTSGIVSALARSAVNINDFNFFIQTDAAINPGNSGGPLVAMDGGVVGINTAIYSRNGGSIGIGFAIPSEMVATIIATEAAGYNGKNGVVRPWSGVSVQKITSDIAQNLGIKNTQGALIVEMHSASPFRKAGVKVGDVVTAINGKIIRDAAEMKFRMATVIIGSEANVDVIRGGKTKSFKVRAMLPPEKPPRDEELLEGAHPLSGVTVSNINPAISVELNIREDKGVVVSSASRQRGMIQVVETGDVIISVNGQDIDNVNDLKKALKDNNVKGWEIVISHNGHRKQIYIR